MDIEQIEGSMGQEMNATPGFRSQKGITKKGQEMSKTTGSIPRNKVRSATPGFNSQKGAQVKMGANP